MGMQNSYLSLTGKVREHIEENSVEDFIGVAYIDFLLNPEEWKTILHRLGYEKRGYHWEKGGATQLK